MVKISPSDILGASSSQQLSLVASDALEKPWSFLSYSISRKKALGSSFHKPF